MEQWCTPRVQCSCRKTYIILKDAETGQEKVSKFDLFSWIPIGDQRLTLYLGPFWSHLFTTRTIGIMDEFSISWYQISFKSVRKWLRTILWLSFAVVIFRVITFSISIGDLFRDLVPKCEWGSIILSVIKYMNGRIFEQFWLWICAFGGLWRGGLIFNQIC